MRHVFTFSVLSSLVALMLIASPLAGAQTAPTAPVAGSAPAVSAAQPTAAAAPSTKFGAAVVAVVDIQKIMHDSTAAKSVREQLAAKRQSYQQEVTADEQKLRESEKKLMEQRGKLSQEEFAKRRTEFEGQVRQVQQKVQQRAQSLDMALNQAIGTIRQSLGKIVAQAAADRGATVVLDRGQTVVVESALDMTTSVLSQLNKDLPKVTVTVSEAAAAGKTGPAGGAAKP